VADLLDMRAVESAAVIERAFAAGRVDEGVAGVWEEVQMKLVLKARPKCAEGSVNYDEPDVWEFDSDKEPTVPDEQAIAEAMDEEDEVMEAEVVPTSVAVRREGRR